MARISEIVGFASLPFCFAPSLIPIPANILENKPLERQPRLGLSVYLPVFAFLSFCRRTLTQTQRALTDEELDLASN